MRTVRTKLKIAPKVHDQEYESRKRTLKELHDAMRTYKSSVVKVKKHTMEAIESLSKMKSVYEKMTDSTDTPASTRDLVMQFGVTMDRVSGDYLAQYAQSMDSDVIPATMEIKKLYDDCCADESERNKLMKEYALYKNEVDKTEASYAKKSKDLTESKNYSSDVVKRNDFQAKFEQSDMKFRDSHDYLIANTARSTNRCMLTLFRCTSELISQLDTEFKTLYTTAYHVEQNLEGSMPQAQYEN